MASARIEAIGLSKSFSGVTLFTDVSFTLGPGVLAVTGPNGSGKTTLLKILASLLRPTSGSVRLEADGRALSGDESRTSIGWSGPDLSFYPELTAAENLSFFRRAAGFVASREDVLVRLETVGLEGVGEPVEHFSTGMKQRLRIAFADLLDPPILILDEPMSGLDSGGRAAVQRVVSSARRRGPVVLASTDVEELPEADQVLELPRREK
ncbi:MAG TPA: ABC transporter ATP-binding protein [Thermoanaerobaculia bacterium]|nr:ABC transporter ATP-binding protein [Thermoanaerobaculia bacterium]